MVSKLKHVWQLNKQSLNMWTSLLIKSSLLGVQNKIKWTILNNKCELSPFLILNYLDIVKFLKSNEKGPSI